MLACTVVATGAVALRVLSEERRATVYTSLRVSTHPRRSGTAAEILALGTATARRGTRLLSQARAVSSREYKDIPQSFLRDAAFVLRLRARALRTRPLSNNASLQTKHSTVLLFFTVRARQVGIACFATYALSEALAR